MKVIEVVGAAKAMEKTREKLLKAGADREKKRVKQQKARAGLMAAQAKVADAMRTNG